MLFREKYQNLSYDDIEELAGIEIKELPGNLQEYLLKTGEFYDYNTVFIEYQDEEPTHPGYLDDDQINAGRYYEKIASSDFQSKTLIVTVVFCCTQCETVIFKLTEGKIEQIN